MIIPMVLLFQRSKAIQEFSVGEETRSLLVVTVEDHEGESSQKVLHQQAVLCGVRKTIYCMYLQN